MQRWTTIARVSGLALALLLLAGCALWFVPESRSRGNIFDDAVRGLSLLSERHSRERLDLVIHQRFPPGTPLADLIGHIESAGGVCSMQERVRIKPGVGSTICTFANSNYFATALMGMGEPYYRLAEHTWTVIVVHAGGAVQSYEIENEVVLHVLSRDDYFDGLNRQRAEEG